MTLANKLTISRLLMVLPFAAILSAIVFMQGDFSYSSLNTKTILLIVSGVIFLVAMITDAIDGYVARKTNTVTSFGKLFDPLADKFITTSAFIFMGVEKLVPLPVIIIFILRDILVDGARNVAAQNKQNIAANKWGKLKTVLQTIAIFITFFCVSIIPEFSRHFTWQYHLLNIPMYLALIASVCSGFIYFKQSYKFLKLK